MASALFVGYLVQAAGPIVYWVVSKDRTDVFLTKFVGSLTLGDGDMVLCSVHCAESSILRELNRVHHIVETSWTSWGWKHTLSLESKN